MCGRKVFCSKKKSLRTHFIWSTLPILMIGLFFIGLLGVGYMYLVFISEMNTIVVHLLKLKKNELLRETCLAAAVKQIILQEPINNNYILKGFFQEVINNKLHISPHFNMESVSINYAETGETDLKMSSWYSSPEITSLEDLSLESEMLLKTGVTLHYPFKNLLLDQLDWGIGVYHHVFYIFEKERMIIQYPAFDKPALTKSYGKAYPCNEKYQEAGFMETYDGRGMDFYETAVSYKYSPKIYGPYKNPSKEENYFVLTLSQAIEKDNEVHGVMNHDIHLNFKGYYDEYLGPKELDMHFYITDFNGTLFKHSDIILQSTNETVTMAEFSDGTTSLDHEPQTNEAKEFRKKIIPLMQNLKKTELTSYYRFGNKYMASMTPMKLRIFDEPGTSNPGTYNQFIFTQVINEQIFVSVLKDDYALVIMLLIWTSIFIGVFFFLIYLSGWTLVKITTRALKPIQLLNTKVAVLVKTHGELSLGNTKQSMNSYEAQKMFEVFSELITTKKFTSNTILKNNDAIAIMEYAEAYTVFRGNKKVQGIGMNNIGHIYQKLHDFDEAAKRYHQAADLSHGLINENKCDREIIAENWKLYCKRKYYEVICLFKHTKQQGKAIIERDMPKMEKKINAVKKLLKERTKSSICDILIMLNLYSSKGLLITRRLISSERDLQGAIEIFKENEEIKNEDRPDIPVIPRGILRQRILLQKALILKAYSRTQEAATLLTKLLKSGVVYDPFTRKEALKTLYSIMTNNPKGNLIEQYPEAKNIEMMLQLFQKNKNKNIVLCADTIDCKNINTK